MINNTNCKLRAVILVLSALFLACSSSEKTLGTEVPSISSKTLEIDTAPLSREPTEVPTPVAPSIALPHPIPTSGKGNLVGQVRWNEIGAADIDLKICTEFSWFGGCKGTIYSATTNAEGIYIFKDVDPGLYALTLKVFETDNWLYMTTGLMSERMYTVKADETTEIGVSDIYKADLKPVQPTDKAKVAESKPTLKWEAYTDATSYELWLNPEHGDAMASSEEVSTNEFSPAEDLFNCDFTWKVEAFNANGIKISEMDDYLHFTITGAEYSCTIDMVKPLNNATVPASGIELEWEAHPLADYYKLFMWPDGDSNTHILDFIEVSETSYTISDTLQPGKYILSIYVYDTNDDQIAGSGITYLIVK